MTQQEKQLLLKDLCARLPYGVKINIRNDYTLTMEDMEFNAYHLPTASYDFEYRGLRPYLRPMSSMTKEEKEERNNIALFHSGNIASVPTYIDFLNKHHFDFRNLIEKGLAIDCTNLNIY